MKKYLILLFAPLLAWGQPTPAGGPAVASQAEVNAGVVKNKYVSPYTLNLWPGGGGGSSAFNAITSGTNTTATMHVGTGATMDATGSGSITFTAGPLAGLTGAGTGVLSALAVNVGSAGAPVLFNGAGGTPSSITLTNATGTAASLTAGTASAVAVGGITGLGTGVATWLATPSGANLASALTTALPASKGGTGLTSLGTGVATALGNTTNGASGLVGLNANLTLTLPGSVTKTPQPLSGSTATLDVTKAYSQITQNGTCTVTASAAGTAGTFIQVDCIDSGGSHVWTFAKFGGGGGFTFTTGAGTNSILVYCDGSDVNLVGGSPNPVDLTADTTPATTKIIVTSDPTSGLQKKSTIAQVHAASAATTETLSNKRNTARVGSTTSSATPTINTDSYDIYKLTAQAADITSMTTNLTGTPVDGDQFQVIITGTAARAITWGTGFVAGPAALPTTTTTTKTLYVYFQFDSVVTHWVCMYSGSLP